MAVSTPVRQKFWSSRDWTLTIQREMTDYRFEVGQRLKALRKSRHLSQEDAAHIAKVRSKTWGLWERGRSAPFESSWKKIAAGFDLSDEEVSAIRGNPPSPLGLAAGNGSEPSAVETQILEALDDIIERLERLEGGPGEPGTQP